MSDPSNARFVAVAHRKGEVTNPATGYTEIGDSQTSPGSGVNVSLEGQAILASDVETIGGNWATSVVGMIGYIEVKNGKALSKNGATNSYDDSTDTTPQAGAATSGWDEAGTYLYNQTPADRYGHWG
jgi:hypothetical protein